MAKTKHKKEKVTLKSTPKATKYRRNPFNASSGRRKSKKKIIKTWKKDDIEKRNESNSGVSWFKQDVKREREKQKFSIDDYEVELSDDEGDTAVLNPVYWLMSLKELQSALSESAVCRSCQSPLSIQEVSGQRAGLATTFTFHCENECQLKTFATSPKQGRIHEINKTSVLAARMIGKGRSGLAKFCSILGLSTPVLAPSFAAHTKFFEEKGKELLEENLAEAVKKVREIEEEGGNTADVIDVATCFDGTWSSRGWSARDGVVTAITEGTSQIVDVVYKTTFCRQCKDKEKAKAEQKISHMDYLEWYLEHEPDCLLNHLGSAQVSWIASVDLLLNSTPSKSFDRLHPLNNNITTHKQKLLF